MSFTIKNKRPRYLGIGQTGIVLSPKGSIQLEEINLDIRHAANKGWIEIKEDKPKPQPPVTQVETPKATETKDDEFDEQAFLKLTAPKAHEAIAKITDPVLIERLLQVEQRKTVTRSLKRRFEELAGSNR